jgi:precorrin-2 dehydrogenase/sirohydrochlorin ferrochelatase
MRTYPVCLVGLEQRRTVVIGGGKVATRKAQALLDAGASITAISPDFSIEFQTLAASSALVAMLRRSYQPGDLQDAFLVIAATDDPLVNQAVWDEAREQSCLVNVVDDPGHSNFILPAVVERGELKIAITTGGASPALARRLREQLEAQIGPEYAGLVQLLAELRPELHKRFGPGEPRRQAALHLVDSDLLAILRQEGWQAARRRALELLLLEQESGG